MQGSAVGAAIGNPSQLELVKVDEPSPPFPNHPTAAMNPPSAYRKSDVKPFGGQPAPYPPHGGQTASYPVGGGNQQTSYKGKST